jgi:hypothetical protein
MHPARPTTTSGTLTRASTDQRIYVQASALYLNSNDPDTSQVRQNQVKITLR